MKILVVDDHPLIREALHGVILRLDPAATVLAAGDTRHGMAIAAAEPGLELVMLDLNLPGLSGVSALKAWRAQHPDLPIVVLSSSDDRQTVLAAMGAGAAGFIPKSSPSDVMIHALRLVLAGAKYLPPEVLIVDAPAPGKAPRRQDPKALSVETLGLTERQLQVLRLIAEGKPNKVICRELDLAERTVKAHISAVFRALGVSSRTQAALAAARLGVGGAAEEA